MDDLLELLESMQVETGCTVKDAVAQAYHQFALEMVEWLPHCVHKRDAIKLLVESMDAAIKAV